MKPTDTEQQPKERPEEFLSRWSKRKQQAREEAAAAEKAPPKTQVEEMPPQLPPVEDLTMDSDYSGFFHPKVDEDVRRAALKKLFDNPHFSIIDGMDIYLDDYSISEPIPAAMLKELKQAQNILEWARERREKEAERERQAAGLSAPEDASAPALSASGATAETPVPQASPASEEEPEPVKQSSQSSPDGPQTA